MSAKIQEISLTTVTEHTGFRGRKQTTEEAVCLKTAGGIAPFRFGPVRRDGAFLSFPVWAFYFPTLFHF